MDLRREGFTDPLSGTLNFDFVHIAGRKAKTPAPMVVDAVAPIPAIRSA